ncbi:hypothetical protein [Tatumella ptyseos]|uniref:hypothetical protein n=1 Tax=Tatumella ptyseos TaxID=82987 RepID=UPI0004B439C4|nr:hypothetical protein [Tatumella ptyseos]
MNCREKIIEQLKRTGDTGRLHWCYVYPGVAHSLLCQKSVGICPLNTITKDIIAGGGYPLHQSLSLPWCGA